jgi:hypothetical protein
VSKRDHLVIGNLLYHRPGLGAHRLACVPTFGGRIGDVVQVLGMTLARRILRISTSNDTAHSPLLTGLNARRLIEFPAWVAIVTVAKSHRSPSAARASILSFTGQS